MDYFDDIHIISADEDEACTVTVDYPIWRGIIINYVHAGSIYFSCGHRPKRILKAGTAYWSWPGPHLQYGSADGSSYHQMWVMATGPRCEAMVKRRLLPTPPYPAQRVADPAGFEHDLRRLIQIVQEGNPTTHAIRAHLFEGLLLELHRPEFEASPANAAFQALIDEIMEDPFADWDFREQARRLNVSYTHFRRKFRQLSHHSPHDYVLSCRMHQAARKIQGQPDRIQQVAYDLGYENYYYFSRLFKQQIGVSPRDYVRNLPV